MNGWVVLEAVFLPISIILTSAKFIEMIFGRYKGILDRIKSLNEFEFSKQKVLNTSNNLLLLYKIDINDFIILISFNELLII